MNRPASSRIGRGLGRLVLVTVALLGTAAVLGLLEVLSGALLHSAAFRRTLAPDGSDFITQTLAALDLAPELNPAPLVSDPVLEWRNQPLARKTQPVNPRPPESDATWNLANDAHGFRGPERARSVPGERTFRVLCVGDSITYGLNVDQERTFARQLEGQLRERAGGRPVEVINAGVPGWSWVQGRTFLEREGMALAPDVVVIGHGTNDQFFPARVTDRERIGATHSRLARAWTALAGALAHANTYRLVQHLVAPRAIEMSPACRRQADADGQCRRVSVAEIADEVERVHQLTADHGAALVVINVDFLETPAVQGVRSAVERDGITFLDLVEEFAVRRTAAEQERATRHRLAQASSAGRDEAASHAVVLRVETTRAGKYSAVGESPFAPFRFDVPLQDDGAGGDEVAGDGVYTGRVTVPSGVALIEYRFHRDGQPELVGQPPLPSTQGVRRLRVVGDTVGPVAEFGGFDLMAERVHPDAAGHRLIAERLAQTVAALPEFQAFAAGRE